MEIKKRVLFVCIHNSARSQMAEAFLNKLGGETFEAESAGFEPGVLNPLVVEAMGELDYDLSTAKTKSVFDFFKDGKRYNYVITVCDEMTAQKCPIFPGVIHRIHWSVEDPASLGGSKEKKLARVRVIRDSVKRKVEKLIAGIENNEILENAPKE